MTVSACNLLPERPAEVKIVTKPVERVIVQPVLPRAISLNEPAWMVVSETNFEDFEKLIKSEKMAFFVMTADDYELMAGNMQEIRRYIREMKEVVIYYRNVTQPNKEEKPDGGKQESNN